MKVLISSYSPQTHTSYGYIVRELWTRLIKTGEFDVTQHAWFNFNSLGPVDWPLISTATGIRPDNKMGFLEEDKYGEQSFEEVLQKVKPDIVWNLSDIYMSRYMDRFKKKYGFKLIRWTLSEGEPIDRDNIPSIIGADKTVAITNYASKKWSEITGEQYPVIYHGIDTNIFKPIENDLKNQIRNEISAGALGPNHFLITYVGRNQARKRPWIPFEILHYLRTGAWGWDKDMNPVRLPWDPIARRHIDNKTIDRYAEKIDAKMWFHSHDDGTRWNYQKLENEWDIKGHVFYTSGLSDTKAVPPDDMARLYQISDVLTMLSGSEGFGVPLIEAAACGVTSVYTDYSGHGEIGGICKGIAVPYHSWEPAPVSHVRWVNPDINQGIQAFYRTYQTNGTNTAMSKKEALHNHVKKTFNYDSIAFNWYELLKQVAEAPRVISYGSRI